MKIVLIDGDILVYTTIFACADESEWWKVKYTAKKVVEELCTNSGATHYLSFLTKSSENFRVKTATTWEYKGSRKSNEEKPKWYDEVREYYQDDLGFQMMRGVEADDALTIAAEALKGTSVVCATVDKDLLQYPWKEFLNIRTGLIHEVTKEAAHDSLWHQVLVGDVATDNIPGLSHAAKYQTVNEWDPKHRAGKHHLVGARGADALLQGWNPSDYAENILNMYEDAYDHTVGNTQEVIDYCEDKGMSFGEYRFYETFALVYMLLEAPEGLEIHYNPLPVLSRTSGVDDEFEDCTDEEL